MPAYTHYRLLVTANNGDTTFTGTKELGLRETSGGASVAVTAGGTASTTASVGGGSAAACFDGVTSGTNGLVMAISTTPLPQSITYQFPTARTIVEYTVSSYYSNTSAAARSFKTWKLQGSNDGSSWTDLDERTNETAWSSPETRVYAITAAPSPITGAGASLLPLAASAGAGSVSTPGATASGATLLPLPASAGSGSVTTPPGYTHYRLTITASNGGSLYTGTREIGLRETVGGASVAVGAGGTASASAALAAGSAAACFDNGLASGNGVAFNLSDLPASVTYQFPYAREIVQYTVACYYSNSDLAARSASAWTLEGSLDGSSWETLDTRSGQAGWVDGEERAFTIGAPAEVSGAGASVFPLAVSAGAGAVLVVGAGASLAPLAVSAGSAGVLIAGAGASTAPTSVSAGTAQAIAGGAGSSTLPVGVSVGTAVAPIAGAGASSLPIAASAGEGLVSEFLPEITGTGLSAAPLPESGGSAVVIVGGTGASTLALAVSAGAGSVSIGGAGATTITLPLSSGTARVLISGAGASHIPLSGSGGRLRVFGGGITPASRGYVVPVEDRGYVVPFEDRGFTVPSD